MEHLRLIARADGIDDGTLVRESAFALASLPPDPSMLVVVCRRLVEKHPLVAPLWWLCSAVLVADDHRRVAADLVERYMDDATIDRLPRLVARDAAVLVDRWGSAAADISARRPDVQLAALTDAAGEPADAIAIVEPFAVSATSVLVRPEVGGALDRFDGEIWLCCPLGTRVAPAVVDRMVAVSGDRVSSVDAARVTHVVADGGREPASPRSFAPDGPTAAELLA